MKLGSLFSGIGGIEVGFEQKGFTTEWFIECDKYCQAVLRKHFPNTKIYGDIAQIDFTTVPKVDILTGGFPCQDISNAGKRAGITGSRSSLWKYYFKAIRELRPKYAVIENVAALANRGLNVVLADLAEIGYDAEWYNLSASAVGAPHRRERIFIIAYPNSVRCIHGQTEQSAAFRREQAQLDSESSCAVVANPTSNGLQETGQDARGTESCGQEGGLCESKGRSGEEDVSNCGWSGLERKQSEERLVTRCGWWATEPELGRVAHGIPNRMERIKSLGNAVVPQCAEVIAQAIKEYEKLRSEA